MDLAGDGVEDGDAVAVQRAGQRLFERGAVGGVARARGDELSIRGGEALLLHQHIGGGGCAEMQLLHLGVEALLVEVVVGDGGVDRGTIVGERILLADDIHADLNVELLEHHLRLAIFNLRARLIGLRGAIAEGDVHGELDTLIRTAAVEEVAEDRAVTGRLQGRTSSGYTEGLEDDRVAEWADSAPQALRTVKSLNVKHGQQTVFHRLQGDFVDLQVQGRLFHIGAIGFGFADQLIDGHVLLGGFGEADAIGGNDGGVGKGRVVEVAGDGLLHDELLVLESVLRGDQRLLVAGHLALGVDHVEGRHAADLELLLVVFFEAGGLVEGVLPGLDVLIGADQAPVDVLYLVDGVEKLLAEDGVGNAAVVFRLDDEAAVDAGAKALQQMLGEREIEGGGEGRAEEGKRIVGCGSRVVECHLHVGAGDEALAQGEIVGIRILIDGRQAAGKERAGLGLHDMIQLNGSGQRGVEILRRRAGAIGRQGQTAGAGTGDTGAGASSARTASNGADRCGGSSLGAGDEAAADATDSCDSGFRMQQVDIGDVEVEALDGDVVVILEREEHRVAEAEIDFAVADEVIELHRVEKTGRRYGDGGIRGEGVLPVAALL